MSPLNEVSVEPADQGIVLTSTGSDPQVETPNLRFDKAGRYYLVVRIELDHADEMQLFFERSGRPYNEPDSTRILLDKGPNLRVIELSSPQTMKKIRLSPGNRKGRYILKEFCVLTFDDRGQINKSASITFLPWEIQFAAMVPWARLSPIPSLQIYAERILPSSKDRVAEYLKSDKAPSILVLGNDAIDSRNPVAELTNWIQPLHTHYDLAAVRNGYAVFQRRMHERATGCIHCRREGPGLLVRLRAAPLSWKRRMLFSGAKTLFKAPEQECELVYVDGDGKKQTVRARAFRSHLEEGALYSRLSPTDLSKITNGERQPEPKDLVARVIEARLIRCSGLRNLPVVPSSVPLDVEYCTSDGLTICNAHPRNE